MTKGMIRGRAFAAAAFGAMALGGCVPMSEETAAGGAQLAQVGPGGDACGAAARQDLVGTSIGSLQAASLPEQNRTIFPGMSVTQDFRPDRLNVEVGGDDRIARVYCG